MTNVVAASDSRVIESAKARKATASSDYPTLPRVHDSASHEGVQYHSMECLPLPAHTKFAARTRASRRSGLGHSGAWRFATRESQRNQSAE
jgi:hypothetical protein